MNSARGSLGLADTLSALNRVEMATAVPPTPVRTGVRAAVANSVVDDNPDSANLWLIFIRDTRPARWRQHADCDTYFVLNARIPLRS